MNFPNGQCLSVLLVEDEILLRLLAAETMRDAGFVVYEASDGMTAFEMLERQADIGLLLSDIQMPSMNGYQLAVATLKRTPSVKILLMTGYAPGPLPPELAEAGIPILRKPFDVDVLTQFARELLNQI